MWGFMRRKAVKMTLFQGILNTFLTTFWFAKSDWDARDIAGWLQKGLFLN